MAKNNQIIVGGLGRPFALGMLYYAPKDQLVPGIALWDSETLEHLTMRRPQKSSNFDISTSDSTKDSSFNLNVDASLKLSFMSGAIEVGGSANYLNDKKEFKNQCRVTLQYQATTHFEQLCLTSDVRDQIQSSQIMERGLATHVVTGIEYGANAFFVFDSQKVEANNVQTVKGQMEATIKKIPECDIEGKAQVNLSEKEKNLVQSFHVKFYGDFLLESNPATFDAAVQTYVNLPKLLIGADGKEPVNTVPVRVWLQPLEVFIPLPGPVTKGISVGLVLEAESTLEDLSSIKMRCNDVLSVSAVGKFPQLQHQLHTFDRLCHYYTVELQRQMAELCPAIREGTKPESDLRLVFEQRHSSPFSQDKLTQWLQAKEREVNVVQACLDIMKDIPVLSTQAEVDRFVLAPGQDPSGCIFTSLENTDQLLGDMGRYLAALKTGESYESLSQTSEDPWYYSDELVSFMRQFATKIVTVPALFIAAIHDTENKGIAFYDYTGGVLVLKTQRLPPNATGGSPHEEPPKSPKSKNLSLKKKKKN